MLKNPRREAFAQAYVRGEHAGNATRCYLLCFDKLNRGGASRFSRRPDVSRRINELADEIIARNRRELSSLGLVEY